MVLFLHTCGILVNSKIYSKHFFETPLIIVYRSYPEFEQDSIMTASEQRSLNKRLDSYRVNLCAAIANIANPSSTATPSCPKSGNRSTLFVPAFTAGCPVH